MVHTNDTWLQSESFKASAYSLSAFRVCPTLWPSSCVVRERAQIMPDPTNHGVQSGPNTAHLGSNPIQDSAAPPSVPISLVSSTVNIQVNEGMCRSEHQTYQNTQEADSLFFISFNQILHSRLSSIRCHGLEFTKNK